MSNLGNLPEKRIFLAIPASLELQRDILEWEKKFSRLPVRWLAGKNLHITLIPPWYERDFEKSKKLLAEIHAQSFPVVFSKVSYGPSQSNPRLIWAEGLSSPECSNLQKQAGIIFGFKRQRLFRPHLTLARFRPENFSSFPVKNLNENIGWQMRVNSVVLMESRLSPQGADYQIIDEHKLL